MPNPKRRHSKARRDKRRAHDALTPPALSEELAAGIAGSRLVVVHDCGHLSTMERPDAVTRVLVEWMAA